MKIIQPNKKQKISQNEYSFEYYFQIPEFGFLWIPDFFAGWFPQRRRDARALLL